MERKYEKRGHLSYREVMFCLFSFLSLPTEESDGPVRLEKIKFVSIDGEREECIRIMPYFKEGSIAKVLRDPHKRPPIDKLPEKIRRWMFQLVKQVRLLHSHGWAHCDLKCENVLYSEEEDRCFLCDWGSVLEIDNLEEWVKVSDGVPRGTIEFMTQETLKSCTYKCATKFSAFCDVWALGCTMIQMAINNHPWKGVIEGRERGFPRIFEILDAMESGKMPHIPEIFCDEAKRFLKRIFTENPTAEDLEKDPYFDNERKFALQKTPIVEDEQKTPIVEDEQKTEITEMVFSLFEITDEEEKKERNKMNKLYVLKPEGFVRFSDRRLYVGKRYFFAIIPHENNVPSKELREKMMGYLVSFLSISKDVQLVIKLENEQYERVKKVGTNAFIFEKPREGKCELCFFKNMGISEEEKLLSFQCRIVAPTRKREREQGGQDDDDDDEPSAKMPKQ